MELMDETTYHIFYSASPMTLEVVGQCEVFVPGNSPKEKE